MIEFKNKVYTGSEGRQSLFDANINPDNDGVVVFIHGYKGFKDWGAWDLMGQEFINQNFGFVKFNISHNGGTVDDPIDFPDLEAFGNNCYSFELNDLKVIINETERLIREELRADIPIHLLGHSRGGGVAILAANESDKVSKVVSLAGICDIAMRFPEGDQLEEWKNSGVSHVLNGRTNQQMPHYFSFYEDFDRNRERLDIQAACENLNYAFLQVHGDMDQSVSISEGQRLAAWTSTELCIIKGAEHTFGTSHPWNREDLPAEMNEAIKAIISFLRS